MSNIYIQEPPSEGKVLLVTSAGDIDVELWSKEAPKACRNFVQLCMEGYYNDTIFHRVVPGFITQGGDPTGSGTGGESIYGKPFKDEFHTRLRFVRRGLVAMANAGKDDNGSQFFFTMGPCPDLQNKHTIFGKVAGDTIYNLPRFEEGEIGKDERPEYPHKIISTEVLNNPFPDIEPRNVLQNIVNEVPKESKKRKKGKKDFKLLSFGDQAEEDEEEVKQEMKKLPKVSNSAHDIAKDPTLVSEVDEDKKDRAEALKRIRDKLMREKAKVKESEAETVALEESPLEQSQETKEKNKMREEVRSQIRALKKELKDEAPSSESEKNHDQETEEVSQVMKDYFENIAKYNEAQKQLPKKGKDRESQTLSLLERFSNKLKKVVAEEDSDEGGSDKDDDNWLKHKLQFESVDPVLAKDANTKDDKWYDIDDPRNVHNKRRREQKQPKTPALKS